MNQLVAMLDTHQHLIYPQKFPYSWTDGIPPMAKKAFTYDDYVELVKGKGVAGTIFMETAPDDPHGPAEAKFIEELSEKSGSLIRGVIATCRPEQSDFASQVEAAKHRKLVGFRRILHVMPDETSQSPTFAANVQSLGKNGFTFDLCYLAKQLPIATALAKKCPGTQLILDHCGVPDIAAGNLDPWRQHIRELAALPNVACKISGLPTYCKPGTGNVATYKPWVDHCLECFGADRLVWGGDWPVVVINSSLPQWIDDSRQLFAKLSEAEQKKIFHDNAMRIYRIKA